MRIAINTRLLVPNKLDGIGYFAHEVLQRLVKNAPQHQFIFVFDRKPHADFIYDSNVETVVIPPQARHPILYYIWFHLSIPLFLKRKKIDLFLSPEGYLPSLKAVPLVNVIHDLNFEHQPEDLPLSERWYYRRFFPRYAKKANHIITVSDFSKQDIISLYGIRADKISTIHNGIRAVFKPQQQRIEENIVKGSPYFLAVGTIHPRKNIEGLLAGFNQFKTTDNQGIKLVIAGRKKWWTESMEKAYESSPYKDDILFLGRLKTEELVKAYQGATALLMLSNFEGFGLPIVEAMACGCPVICSNIPAFKEVAQKAALIVDKDNAIDIAASMTAIANNAEQREKLIKAGYEISKQFSWDTAAKEVQQIIEEHGKA